MPRVKVIKRKPFQDALTSPAIKPAALPAKKCAHKSRTEQGIPKRPTKSEPNPEGKENSLGAVMNRQTLPPKKLFQRDNAFTQKLGESLNDSEASTAVLGPRQVNGRLPALFRTSRRPLNQSQVPDDVDVDLRSQPRGKVPVNPIAPENQLTHSVHSWLMGIDPGTSKTVPDAENASVHIPILTNPDKDAEASNPPMAMFTSQSDQYSQTYYTCCSDNASSLTVAKLDDDSSSEGTLDHDSH